MLVAVVMLIGLFLILRVSFVFCVTLFTFVGLLILGVRVVTLNKFKEQFLSLGSGEKHFHELVIPTAVCDH